MLVRTTLDALHNAARSGDLKTASTQVRRPEVADALSIVDPFQTFLGPQARSDRAWVRRMRLHQSWWRTFRLRCGFGFGPTHRSTRRYGNMLDDSASARGLNFLTNDARRAYDERVSETPEGVDPWRTRRNLLASQPLAFNVFGHLRYNLDVATRVLRAVLDPATKEVTSVEVERLSSALGDRTAFDAFICYHRDDDSRRCVAVETKLTEPFSQALPSTPAGAHPWDRYLAHTAFDRTEWTSVDPAVLGNLRWSQLWRNHLLARAESAADRRLGEPTVLVVHHPEDPHCAADVEGYRELVAQRECVQALDLRRLTEALAEVVVGDAANEQWVRDLHDRYVNLELSAPLLALLQR